MEQSRTTTALVVSGNKSKQRIPGLQDLCKCGKGTYSVVMQRKDNAIREMGTIQAMSAASSIHHASMPFASTIKTPGSLPTMLTFVPAFFHQIEVWGGALPELIPGGLAADAASCSGFEKLVIWVHLVIGGNQLAGYRPMGPIR